MVDMGSIVIPKRGRDKGMPMIVIRRDGEFCWLADGKLRRLENPKKKKMIHIQPTNSSADDIKQRLDNGLYVNNADIRKCIKAFKGGSGDVEE